MTKLRHCLEAQALRLLELRRLRLPQILRHRQALLSSVSVNTGILSEELQEEIEAQIWQRLRQQLMIHQMQTQHQRPQGQVKVKVTGKL
jgi:hypothetical protein